MLAAMMRLIHTTPQTHAATVLQSKYSNCMCSVQIHYAQIVRYRPNRTCANAHCAQRTACVSTAFGAATPSTPTSRALLYRV
jgi:hypothetical protein